MMSGGRPMTERACGACTLCCTTHKVARVTRAGRKCKYVRHPSKGFGCQLYGTTRRPTLCGDFLCLWRQAPREVFPDELRPDRVGAVMTPTEQGDGIVFHVDPARPNAWRTSPLRGVAQVLVERERLRVFVANHKTGERSVLLPTPDETPPEHSSEGVTLDAELAESESEDQDAGEEAGEG